VPSDELSNIFRPFYRIADARDRQSGGVGLGLAVAERVARVHGGSIRADNRPGGGLEVELTLKH
jgi:two-component system sensor histidine kinase CpxA